MIVFLNYNRVPNNFTGVCKITINDSINFFENGKLHKEDGPAVEYSDGNKEWYYKDNNCGYNRFSDESWKDFVKELKYFESLEIFK